MHNKQLRELELHILMCFFMAIKRKTIQAVSGLAPQGWCGENPNTCDMFTSPAVTCSTIMEKKRIRIKILYIYIKNYYKYKNYTIPHLLT